MNKKDILQFLNQYTLPTKEFIILSGAALVLFEIKKETSDIDLSVTKKLYENLLKQYNCTYEKKDKNGDAIYFIDSVLNFGLAYNDVSYTLYEGYQVQTPSSVKQLKLSLNRIKDKKDIDLIEKWEKSHG